MHKYCIIPRITRFENGFKVSRETACEIRSTVSTPHARRSRQLAFDRATTSRYFQSVRVYKRVETSRTRGWREEDNFYWKSAGIPASTIVTPLTETGDGKFPASFILRCLASFDGSCASGVELVASCRRMQKPPEAKLTARNLTANQDQRRPRRFSCPLYFPNCLHQPCHDPTTELEFLLKLFTVTNNSHNSLGRAREIERRLAPRFVSRRFQFRSEIDGVSTN